MTASSSKGVREVGGTRSFSVDEYSSFDGHLVCEDLPCPKLFIRWSFFANTDER